MPHTSDELLSSPPFNIINRADIIERFGSDKLALLLEMAAAGDALADSTVFELSQAPVDTQGILDTGIRKGRDNLQSPPDAVGALLEQTETIPQWVDETSIQRGSEAYLSIGSLWLTISLGPGSLAHTYSSPTVAKVLMGTGNLDDRAARRLAETATWEQQALRPGGLIKGSEGYIHTLQVRMLHARVRAGLRKRGWNQAELGMPISQLDMLRTWLDFTYVPFSALEKIGITFDQREFQDLYHMWQLVAHLLGIEPRFYRQVVDQHSAAQLLALIDASCAGPDENSRALTERMLTALGELLQPALGLPEDVTVLLMHAFCRRFHGDEFADKLGAQENWTANLLPIITDANRYQRQLERSDSAVRQRKIAQTLTSFDKAIAALEGKTTYQSSIDAVASEELPQTA